MPRYKPYDYKQLMMIAVSLEEQLVPGTLQYAIHHLIEELIDTSFFDERFCNDEEGRSAYDPKVLLKIVLFGYSRGIISSRPLERACLENVTFTALACGQKPGIVEPVFGNIWARKRLDRFTLTGKIKVNIQWMLYCLVHNIEKVLHFGMSYAMAA